VISYESIYRFIYTQIARHKDYRWRRYLRQEQARLSRPQRRLLGKLHRSPCFLGPTPSRRRRSQNARPLGSRPDAVLKIRPGDPHRARTAIPPAHRHAARQQESRAHRSSPDRAVRQAAAPPASQLHLRQRHRVPIAGCTGSRSRPSSATPMPPGRRAASRMRSAACAGSFRARPTSPPSRTPSSTPLAAYNNTPRKCLDWRTPAETFLQVLHFECESTSPLSRGRTGQLTSALTDR
jgi:transposase, IS30 family